MNREEFLSRFAAAPRTIDASKFSSTIAESIDKESEGRRNLIIAMEEMSELTKEITKYLRGKGDHFGLIEEIGDVQLALFYIQRICGIEGGDVKKAMNVKMYKVDDVIKNGKIYE